MSQPPGWTVEMYVDARGRQVVSDWLHGLGDKDRARVARTIGLLAEHGAQLGMPHSRHLRGKLYELRVSVGRRDYRVLYFATVGRRFVLLHGFSKKTDKTPAREMETAERRMADFLARQEGSRHDEPKR